jgi:hypothetical protein
MKGVLIHSNRRNRRFARLALAISAILTGALCASPVAASLEVAYDQTTGTPGGYLPTNKDAGMLTDDFTVPPGPSWWVQSVHVDGQGGAGSKFTWIITPGDAAPARPKPIPSIFDIASSTRVTDPLPGTGSFDIPVDPRYPVRGRIVAPGHYWLGVVASDFSSSTKPPSEPWAWQTQTPLSGFEAFTLSKKECGIDDWTPLPRCGKTGPDLRFRIEGQRMDRGFSKLKLEKLQRLPAGGIQATLVLPVLGVVKVRRVGSKKGDLRVHLGDVRESDQGNVIALLKVKPKGATKAAMKQGLVLRPKIAITYAPGELGDTAPSKTTIFKFVLKKAR